MGEVGASVDVSAVGTLVWVRRPNGSWWPGRVVSPVDVPDSCPAPPRSPATPILLLGRRDGPVFVDWCNLERCKRVKPFRCGDQGLEDCIRKAEQQQAAWSRRRRDQRVCGSTRYARKEDAVLQALDIERQALPLRLRSSSRPTAKPSRSVPAPVAAVQPSFTRKRRTPNDSEDDAPQRMKDLNDIGAPKKMTPTFADLNQHLPSTSQMKRSKQSHHHDDKRKPSADQNQPCGAARKRDRSRPLSELCNGDAWKNGFKPLNGQRANQHFMRAASSLDTVMVRSSSRRAVAPVVKMEPVDDAFPCGSDGPVDAHLAARSVLKADHLYLHQPCASAKAPTWECTKRASNCSKDGIPSQCDSRNSKKKATSSVAHEGGNKIKTEPGCDGPKGRVAKHKAASNGVVFLEKRAEKAIAADKTTAPDAYKDLPVIPNGLDRVSAVVLQQHSGKCKLEEPSETISNRTERENVLAQSVVVEPQVLPSQHRDPVVARCHAVKPVKTVQLNSSLYNVELSAQGGSSSINSKGGRVPLVSLMSRSSRRPVVGYPVSVEVLDTPPHPPAASKDGDHPSTSNTANRPMKEEKEEAAAAAPRRPMLPSSSLHRASNTANRPMKEEKEEAAAAAPRRPMLPSSSLHRAPVTRAKAKSRRKASEDDELWRPHTKNDHQAAASPRKMRRLSSLAPSQRVGGGGRTAAVGELCRSHGPALACVPLRLVFSRIHEALTYSGR